MRNKSDDYQMFATVMFAMSQAIIPIISIIFRNVFCRHPNIYMYTFIHTNIYIYT